MARKNWLLGVGAVAVIAVPLGVALKQDLTGEKKAPAPAPAAPVASVVDAGVAPKPAVTRMDETFFRDVLGTSQPRPSLVGPFFRVKWGLSRVDLSRIAPEFYRWHHPQVVFRPQFDSEGGLTQINIEFPDDGTAGERLRAAWGPPEPAAKRLREVKGLSYGRRLFWHTDDLMVSFGADEPEAGKARVELSKLTRSDLE